MAPERQAGCCGAWQKAHLLSFGPAGPEPVFPHGSREKLELRVPGPRLSCEVLGPRGWEPPRPAPAGPVPRCLGGMDLAGLGLCSRLCQLACRSSPEGDLGGGLEHRRGGRKQAFPSLGLLRSVLVLPLRSPEAAPQNLPRRHLFWVRLPHLCQPLLRAPPASVPCVPPEMGPYCPALGSGWGLLLSLVWLRHLCHWVPAFSDLGPLPPSVQGSPHTVGPTQ